MIGIKLGSQALTAGTQLAARDMHGDVWAAEETVAQP